MDRMPERIDSKFRYVLLAANRAEQMMRGGRPKIEMADLKASRIAMEEISNDLVDWDYGPAEVAEEEGDLEAAAESA